MSDKNDLLALTAALAPEEFVEIALQLRAERDALRAELAQERNERDATADMLRELRADYDDLRAENERLRAALEQIGNLKEVNDDTLTDAVMLASRALVRHMRA